MNGNEKQNLVLNSYHNSSHRVQEKNYVGDVVSTSDSQPILLTRTNKRDETMDRIYERSVLTNTEKHPHQQVHTCYNTYISR